MSHAIIATSRVLTLVMDSIGISQGRKRHMGPGSGSAESFLFWCICIPTSIEMRYMHTLARYQSEVFNMGQSDFEHY